MQDLEKNKALVQRLGDAINEYRLDLLDDLLAPGFVRHCQATPTVEVRSLVEFKRFLEADRVSVPDMWNTSRFMVAEGDLVALWCTGAGTQTGPWGPIPATDKRFEFDFGAFFRIAGGKIAEMWITWDNLAVLAQIGAIPPPLAAQPAP
jgi:predicted ester cyclase